MYGHVVRMKFGFFMVHLLRLFINFKISWGMMVRRTFFNPSRIQMGVMGMDNPSATDEESHEFIELSFGQRFPMATP